MVIAVLISLAAVVLAADLNLTCNLNLCPSSVRGDNYCDKNCMFPYCNYDSTILSDTKTQMYSSDCTWSCVFSNGCTSSHLGDGNCDSDCNSRECGYDSGDCGYCASGCKLYSGYEFMLGGTCDTACNVSACYYDLGACTTCAENCTTTMLGDGICDPECDNSDCNFDFGDCEGSTCAPKCYNYMVGDSICQDACHVAECNYDNFDCDCYPGCSSTMLGNGVCDSVCNTAGCYYDNYDCGDCASGCFTSMLGDLQCNEECNNTDCNWDYGDCGCASGCALSDYGTCKPECLVAQCAYDQLSSDPDKRCNDYALVMFDLRQNLVWHSFDFQPDYEWCYEDSWKWDDYYWEWFNCDEESAYDYTSCNTLCEVKSCIFSWINCWTEQSLYCYQDSCEWCFGAYDGECYQCKENYYQYFGWCWEMCTYGYEPWSIMGSNPICLPLIDTTTPENPRIFYATSIRSGDTTGGDGTLEKPFETFATALAKIQNAYSVLYLINDGNYEWAIADHLYTVSGWLYDETKPLNHDYTYDYGSLKYLKIASLDGSTITIKTVLDKWDIHIEAWKGLELIVENVILDGYNTASSCKGTEYCDYCPYVEQQLDSSYKNDRDEEISSSDFLPSSYCKSSNSVNLFGVYYGASLTLTNVTIKNWRTGYFAMIESWGGEITLTNVNFDNIYIYSGETAAVISVHDCEDSTYNCGFINYTNGNVTRINNGYEYSDPIDFRGFIYSERTSYVSLININFQNNFVSIQTSSSFATASLIALKIFRFLEIENCNFDYNIADTGIVSIASKGLSFMTYVNEDKELVDLLLNHVYIHDCQFTHNYGKYYGVLSASYQGELQNIKLENLVIDSNGVQSGPLIYVKNNEIKKEYLNDTTKPVTLPSGQRTSAVYKARWFSSKYIDFTNNYLGAGVLNIINLVNLEVNNLLIDSNGAPASEEVTVNSVILDYWIKDSEMYPKLTYSEASVIDCEKMAYLSGVVNASVFNINLTNNYCEEDTPAFWVSNAKDTEIWYLNCTGNQGTGDNPLCISVEGQMNTKISDCVFYENTNHLSSGVGAIGTTIDLNNLTVEHCVFKLNSAGYGGALLFQGQYLNLTNLLFESNDSPTQFGGAVYFYPELINSKSGMYVQNCNFTKNNALSSGGAIYIEEANLGTSKIDFQLTNCIFDRNTANSGAAIFIEKTAALTEASTVSKSQFFNNAASDLGVFSALQYNGILTISDCEFTTNSAKLGAAIYINSNEDTTSVRSQTIVSSCTITNNSGDSIVCMDDLSQYSYLETKNCIFESNSGTAVALNYDYWVDSGSVFRYNSAIKRGGAINLQNEALAESKNAIFFNNTNKGTGGTVTISSQSVFQCNACNFTNNYAGNSGGVFFVEQNSYFAINNSIITQNSCANKGSVMYLLGTSSAPSYINSTDIYDNHASKEGSIVLLDAAATISSSKIHENYAENTSPGILLTLSSVTISDSHLYSQTGKQGCFVYASTQSYLTISNTDFTNGVASGSGGAIFSISSTLNIKKSQFINIYANSEGAILAYSDTILNIEDSSFWNTTSVTSGGIIGASQSSITIQNSNFDIFSSSGIYGEKLYSLHISGSRFDEGFGVYGGSIYCSMCSQITIKNSEFSNCNATIGGAVYLITQSDMLIQNTYVVDSTKFIKNSATNGGAVYTNNVKLSVKNSELRENSALASDSTLVGGVVQYGVGGGLYMNCKDVDICEFSLTNNIFAENKATYNGGAYSWNDIMPTISGNTFTNNSAAYGSDVSSYPISMAAIDTSDSADNSTRRRLAYTPVIMTLNGVASGQSTSLPLPIALVDHDGNVAKTDNSSQAELQPTDTETTIGGKTKVTAVQGEFHFSDFTIVGTPGDKTQIKIYTSAIDVSKAEKAHDNATYNSEIYINVTFRLCEIGEATVGDTCKVCEANYYSLNPKNPACLACPDGAICLGNYTMIPKSGYWRTSKYTNVFWKCPNSNACLGSTSSENISYTGECSTGYKGNMCQSCDYGYSKTGSDTCSRCPDKATNSLRIIGIFIALIVLGAIMVKSTRDSAFVPKSLTSVYIKIFMNYLQLVMLVTTFNLNWPSLVLQVFSAQNNTGSATDQIFSFDCFLQTSKSDPDIYYFNKLILMSLMPIGIALLALLIWIFIDLKRRSFRHFTNNYVSTCIILLFIVHPNIVKMLFGSFNCKQINSGEYWLSDNLDIRCWGRQHLFYLFVVSIPAVIVWGIGIPAVCLLNLMKNKRKLNELNVRLKFGFFFNGYTSSCYYWEFIILYRKILIICCSVFLANISISIQALTVTVILVTCLHLQYRYRPYNGKPLNTMELRSILVSAFTIYAGLYYLTNDLDDWSSLFFFLLIVFVNLYFLYFWLIKLCHAGLYMLAEKIPLVRKLMGHRPDGFEDEIFHNTKKGHVFSNDGEKMFSLLHEMKETKDLPKPFDPKLTMADMFISVIPEFEAGKEVSVSSFESQSSISELQTSSNLEPERERHTNSTLQELSEREESEDESVELKRGESEEEQDENDIDLGINDSSIEEIRIPHKHYGHR